MEIVVVERCFLVKGQGQRTYPGDYVVIAALIGTLGYRPYSDVRYDVLYNLLTMVKDVNVMVLMKRILWPKQGEEVAIYQRGNLVIEGHVLYSGTDSVTILGTDAVTGSIDGKALSDGIDDGTITIKKKPRGWKGETR